MLTQAPKPLMPAPSLHSTSSPTTSGGVKSHQGTLSHNTPLRQAPICTGLGSIWPFLHQNGLFDVSAHTLPRQVKVTVKRIQVVRLGFTV